MAVRVNAAALDRQAMHPWAREPFRLHWLKFNPASPGSSIQLH